LIDVIQDWPINVMSLILAVALQALVLKSLPFIDESAIKEILPPSYGSLLPDQLVEVCGIY
jgi:hypothetical protein